MNVIDVESHRASQAVTVDPEEDHQVLALLWDSKVYRCVYEHFDEIEGRENFHVGLRMDEQDDWEWVFRNNAGEEDSEPFGRVDDFYPEPWLGEELESDYDCASFHSDPGNASWDYWHLDEDPCDDPDHDPARPLCVVVF